MQEQALGVHDRIAARVRDLRAAQSLSLEALAARSGVSRSMISLIERGESSPTAVVLEKLAAGLDVTLASLFDAPAERGSPVARRDEQPVWVDPASGYVRRNVSPAAAQLPVQLVEVRFPAGSHVAFEAEPREPRVQQLVWVLEGAMTVTVGDDRHELAEGDCLAMRLGAPTMFHNPGGEPARYAVVIATDAGSRP